MTDSTRRLALLLALVAMATALAVWATWPRPDLTIEVEKGGSAFAFRRGFPWLAGRAPLGDTIVIPPAARIRLINHDTVTASLGVVAARSGEDVTLTGPLETGAFTLDCTAHPGRGITWVIR